MKILYLASSWPSSKFDYIGHTFFFNRIKILPAAIDFDIYSILPRESTIMKLIRRVIPNYRLNPLFEKNEIQCKNFKWKFLYYKENFLSKLQHRKNIALIVDEIVKQIIQIPNFYEYSLIHAQFVAPLGLAARKIKQKTGIPYVIKAHGSDIHSFPFISKRNMDLTLEALENADKVIFVSQKLLSIAKSFGYKADNYEVIPNGIDPDIFMVKDKQAIKKELDISKNIVGFVGHLLPVKRVDKFTEIFKHIANKHSDVQFLIVGKGYLRKKLEKNLKYQAINTTFIGEVHPDKVPYYMNAMDVLILPSRNEGWPCVVLEAHACGVPVVGSINGGIPEAVGNTDFIVEEGEDFEKHFAEKVCEVLEENINSAKLVKRAIKYTWQKVVDSEVEIYREIESNRNNNAKK